METGTLNRDPVR